VKILLVEDSNRLRRSLGDALRRSGHVVDATGDGEEGLWYAQENEYDVLVLDLMLPGLDGLTILRKLRAADDPVPVLVLTAKDTVEDRVRGLAGGADDYLIKPFALEEMLARVEALGRRKYGSKQAILKIGDLQIDRQKRTVTQAGLPVEMAAREYRLLEYLALRKGQLIERAEIEMHLYDSEAEPMSNVVDSAISTLRKKMAQSGAPPLIRTRRGLGYILEDPA